VPQGLPAVMPGCGPPIHGSDLRLVRVLKQSAEAPPLNKGAQEAGASPSLPASRPVQAGHRAVQLGQCRVLSAVPIEYAVPDGAPVCLPVQLQQGTALAPVPVEYALPDGAPVCLPDIQGALNVSFKSLVVVHFAVHALLVHQLLLVGPTPPWSSCSLGPWSSNPMI
jgi:hypothetical protein